MLQFIREYAPGHWAYEIVDAVYEKFGVKISKSGIKSKLRRLHIITNAKQGRGMRELAHRLTTPEQDELVREKFHNKKTGSYKEVQAFLLSLGVDFNLDQVKSYLDRRGIKLGVYGYFPKGHEPAKPIAGLSRDNHSANEHGDEQRQHEERKHHSPFLGPNGKDEIGVVFRKVAFLLP